MSVGADTKGDMEKFVNLILDRNLEFKNRVQSGEGEDLDTAMFTYSGRLSISDLEVIESVFDADRVEIGNEYMVIGLPESLQKTPDF